MATKTISLELAALMEDGRVRGLVPTGVYSSSATELELTTPELAGFAGHVLDLVVHDVASNASATLSSLVVPLQP